MLHHHQLGIVYLSHQTILNTKIYLVEPCHIQQGCKSSWKVLWLDCINIHIRYRRELDEYHLSHRGGMVACVVLSTSNKYIAIKFSINSYYSCYYSCWYTKNIPFPPKKLLGPNNFIENELMSSRRSRKNKTRNYPSSFILVYFNLLCLYFLSIRYRIGI